MFLRSITLAPATSESVRGRPPRSESSVGTRFFGTMSLLVVVSIASIMVSSEEFEAASSFNLAKLYCLHCFRVGYIIILMH